MKTITFFLLVIISWQIKAQTSFTPPYSTDFENYTTEAEFLVDWSYENNLPTDQAGVWGFDYTAYFGYNSSNCPFYFTASSSDGDDWLFSPGFNLTQATSYTLSFLFAGAYEGYTEKMKVYTGTTDSSTAMTQMLHDFTSITSPDFEPISITFTVPATGVYYFGFHALSTAGNFGILIDNFSIDNGTGIDQSQVPSHMFPNPCNGILQFSDASPKEIQLYSTDGKMILHTMAEKQLNVSEVPDGIYFIRTNKDQAAPLIIRRQ